MNKEHADKTNESQSGIWKKPRTGPAAVFAGFLLIVAATFVIVFCLGLLTRITTGVPNLLALALVIAVGGPLAAMGAFWFIRWLTHLRNLRRFLFGLVCVATLIGLFYAEENLRGKWMWNRFKSEWEAKGEKFVAADAAPPPVPDEDNFAMAPVVASSYSRLLDRDGRVINPENTNIVNRLDISARSEAMWRYPWSIEEPPTGNWRKGERADLAAWQAYYRKIAAHTNEFTVSAQSESPAADVLFALSKFDSVIEELRQAGRRSASRFPLNYDEDNPGAVFLPHLASLQGCVRTLQLRVLAELELGQTEKALDDLKLILRLAEAVHKEPIAISQLVRAAMIEIAMQPIWQGIADRKWSDAQLAALDREFRKLDFLADYRTAMRGELLLAVGVTDYLRRHRSDIHLVRDLFVYSNSHTEPEDTPSPWSEFLAAVAPGGRYRQAQLREGEIFVRWYLPVVDLERHVLSPTAARRADDAVARELNRRGIAGHLELWGLRFPKIRDYALRFARAQVSVDLARVAIALERHRLLHGDSPDTLTALSPQFIDHVPHDVINGQPLHYRREKDQRFILYSVGWNEADDVGKLALTRGGGIDSENGDWAWRGP